MLTTKDNWNHIISECSIGVNERFKYTLDICMEYSLNAISYAHFTLFTRFSAMLFKH